MPEYNGITYEKAGQRVQKDGRIEVDAAFHRDSIHRFCTFVFDSEADIIADFDSRCEKKIKSYISKRTRTVTNDELRDLITAYIFEFGSITQETAVAISTQTVEIPRAI